MKLRKLETRDADYMLEWMHDAGVVCDMQADFQSKTLEDCKKFIDQSYTEKNIHMAVVDENDEYMGTVSLKNIDSELSCAEFAITIRSCSMGKGYSRFAVQEILRIGFDELKLQYIYWYVNNHNLRAVKFYEKMRFSHMHDETLKKELIEKNNIYLSDITWYIVKIEQYEKTI